jgi:mRNA-degrading endonuclease RelE of RelBE toxin-antitoxin system
MDTKQGTIVVRFVIVYVEEATRDMLALRPHERRVVLDEVDEQLALQPAGCTRRKKMLRTTRPPWNQLRPVWQLRVADVRVFYDVDESAHRVIVRAIRRKGRRTTGDIL